MNGRSQKISFCQLRVRKRKTITGSRWKFIWIFYIDWQYFLWCRLCLWVMELDFKKEKKSRKIGKIPMFQSQRGKKWYSSGAADIGEWWSQIALSAQSSLSLTSLTHPPTRPIHILHMESDSITCSILYTSSYTSSYNSSYTSSYMSHTRLHIPISHASKTGLTSIVL